MVELRKLAIVIIVIIAVGGFVYFAIDYPGEDDVIIDSTQEEALERKTAAVLSIDSIEFGSPSVISLSNIELTNVLADDVKIVVDGRIEDCDWIEGIVYNERLQGDAILGESSVSCTLVADANENSAIFAFDMAEFNSQFTIINSIDFGPPTIVTVTNIHTSPILTKHIHVLVNADIIECRWDTSMTAYDDKLGEDIIKPQESAECTLKTDATENQGIYAGTPPGFENFYDEQLEFLTP